MFFLNPSRHTTETRARPRPRDENKGCWRMLSRATQFHPDHLVRPALKTATASSAASRRWVQPPRRQQRRRGGTLVSSQLSPIGGEKSDMPSPSSAASRAAAAARPGVAYSLGRTLYLALTNRSNATSIIDTRGPSFVMPPASRFQLLPDDLESEPTPEELAAIVDACYADMDIVGMGENDPGVVFAGAGEPLLRLDAIAVGLRDFSQNIHLCILLFFPNPLSLDTRLIF